MKPQVKKRRLTKAVYVKKKTVTINFGPDNQKEMNDDYNEYMMSTEWAEKRKIALAKAGHRCELCYSPFNLEVHHRTYKRFRHEQEGDLTVVCHTCHVLFHSNRTLYQL